MTDRAERVLTDETRTGQGTAGASSRHPRPARGSGIGATGVRGDRNPGRSAERHGAMVRDDRAQSRWLARIAVIAVGQACPRGWAFIGLLGWARRRTWTTA